MGNTGANNRLCDAGEEGEDDDGEEDALGAKLAVEVDLALDDIAGKV